jgi:hypothetical protein
LNPGGCVKALRIYYGATAVFLLLDYVAGFNIRLAFLDPWPAWRALYYLLCFACLGLIVWRPALTTLVTTIESLITLSALILGMGVRVISLSATVMETGGAIVTTEEILNFLLSGMAAWVGWFRGLQAVERSQRGK